MISELNQSRLLEIYKKFYSPSGEVNDITFKEWLKSEEASWLIESFSSMKPLYKSLPAFKD